MVSFKLFNNLGVGQEERAGVQRHTTLYILSAPIFLTYPFC